MHQETGNIYCTEIQQKLLLRYIKVCYSKNDQADNGKVTRRLLTSKATRYTRSNEMSEIHEYINMINNN